MSRLIPRMVARGLMTALMTGAVIHGGTRTATAASSQAQDAPQAANGAAALIGDRSISTEDVEKAAGGRLLALRNQEYALKRQILEEIISRTLLEREAKARGVTVDELLQAEVEAKAPLVTDDEKKAMYGRRQARYKDVPEAQALDQIGTLLRPSKVAQRRAAFLKELRTAANVRLLMDAPRVAIEPTDDPALGPPDAPVTLVEFSDFQCPYCSRMKPIVARLRATYGDRLRIVFRDFPLVQIHSQAAKAAEAASCAHAQGKFWEMHDVLFENQARLTDVDLKRYAADLGLNAAQFNTCLDSGAYAAEWQADLEDGKRYGVTGTPTSFVNGRAMNAAQPFESFIDIIDDELERAAGRAANRQLSQPGRPAAEKKR